MISEEVPDDPLDYETGELDKQLEMKERRSLSRSPERGRSKSRTPSRARSHTKATSRSRSRSRSPFASRTSFPRSSGNIRRRSSPSRGRLRTMHSKEGRVVSSWQERRLSQRSPSPARSAHSRPRFNDKGRDFASRFQNHRSPVRANPRRVPPYSLDSGSRNQGVRVEFQNGGGRSVQQPASGFPFSVPWSGGERFSGSGDTFGEALSRKIRMNPILRGMQSFASAEDFKKWGTPEDVNIYHSQDFTHWAYSFSLTTGSEVHLCKEDLEPIYRMRMKWIQGDPDLEVSKKCTLIHSLHWNRGPCAELVDRRVQNSAFPIPILPPFIHDSFDMFISNPR